MMKKKILFGLGAIAIAVALAFNVSIAKNDNGSSLDLSMISSTATAQAEQTQWCRWSSYFGRCACYGVDGPGSCMGICYPGNYWCS